MLVLGFQKAEEKLTSWVDQMEEGLHGIYVEWKVRLDRELISTREALRTQINQKTVAMELRIEA